MMRYLFLLSFFLISCNAAEQQKRKKERLRLEAEKQRIEDSIKDARIDATLKEIRSKNQSSGIKKSVKDLAKHLIDNESKVLDAYINDSGYLYVQVRDDGTNRNGYASYLCDEARAVSPNRNIRVVRVMKVNTFDHPDRFNAYGIRLGESRCN